MNRQNEKGVALVLALIVISVLSVLAVSFIFLSQSETWSSLNYRLTSQARDGAEAGINAAARYIANSYTPPTNSSSCVTEDLSCYNMNVYPIQWASNAAKNVGLVATGATVPPGVTLDYPISGVKTAFNTNGVGYGTVTAGTTTVNYTTSAQLLAMRRAAVYGGAFATFQTWRIVTDATINNGIRNAHEQLTMIMDKPMIPMWGYAAFATSKDCAALTFSQANTSTKSYDSTVPGGPAASIQSNGGNVGTNGNLTILSNADIYGSLSTPAAGSGTCVNGVGGASTAVTQCAGCTLTGGVIELPQPITYPPPDLPTAMPDPYAANQTTNSKCSTGNIPHCDDTGLPAKEIRLSPGTYNNLALGSAMSVVHLTPGKYNLNSFDSKNTTIVIDSTPVDAITGTAVILNVTGCLTLTGGAAAVGTATTCATYMPTAVEFSASGISNPSYNPINFQVQYAGPNAVNVKCGNTENSVVVYAPNANVTLYANGSLYGSVIGKSVNVASNATIYYDRNLQSTGFAAGSYMLGGFNWAKF